MVMFFYCRLTVNACLKSLTGNLHLPCCLMHQACIDIPTHTYTNGIFVETYGREMFACSFFPVAQKEKPFLVCTF
jgi:hypothetical protein